MGAFVRGFSLEGFVLDGFCPSPLLSEYIRKINITFNFRFCIYEIFFQARHHMLLDPLPPSQTVTPSRIPSPSSVTYFKDGPQNHFSLAHYAPLDSGHRP